MVSLPANDSSPVHPHAGERRGVEPPSLDTRAIGIALSIVLHALLILLLVTTVTHVQRGAPQRHKAKIMTITLAPPAPPRVVPVPVPPPVIVPPTPPQPVVVAKVIPKPQPAPTPAPAPPVALVKPKVIAKPVPVPAPAAPPVVAPKAPVLVAPKPVLPPPPPPPPETPEVSLSGKIHENWLRPTTAKQPFRCNVRIDYLAGGRITNVTFQPGCGDYDLEESVRKAIWKTQPLPVPAAKTAPGSITIGFTP